MADAVKKEAWKMGDMLFFGGLAGAGLCLLLCLILIPVFKWQRKRLLKMIEEGYED